GGEDDAGSVHFLARRRHDAVDRVTVEDEVLDPRRESDLAAACSDRVADRLHDAREPVRADVRVRVDEDVRRRAVANEDLDDAAPVAALRRPRVELPVGDRPRAALAEAVIAVRVDDALPVDACDVETPPADVPSPLQDDGPHPALDQAERGEEPPGTRADD